MEEGKTKCLGKSKGRKYPPMDSEVNHDVHWHCTEIHLAHTGHDTSKIMRRERTQNLLGVNSLATFPYKGDV